MIAADDNRFLQFEVGHVPLLPKYNTGYEVNFEKLGPGEYYHPLLRFRPNNILF
jgi:hypothetical protein